jgi:WD40 repeat protein
VSADGKRLLAASANGDVQIWDIEKATVLSSYRNLKSTVWGAVFNHTATQIACVSGFDGSISIWDARTVKEVRTHFAHPGGAYSIAFSSDGKYLASTGFDRTAKIFDAGTGELLHTLSGHTNAIYKVTFSRDGSTLATASADKTVRLWDLRTYKEIGAPRRSPCSWPPGTA